MRLRTYLSVQEAGQKKKFAHSQLIDQPECVQRYFKHVLHEGQLYISYARITHNGTFKEGLNKPWSNITGEQYATTVVPGFIWKGTTAKFTARDMYINNKGRLVVTLFSVVKVVNAHGDTFDQGELLRWLAESLLYPTNLLPGERLQWHPIDAFSAKLDFTYQHLSLFLIATFNEKGEIIQLETQRYMSPQKLETWIIKVSDYQKVSGMLIPMKFEVLWRLKTGDFSYAKFNITSIEYDIPHPF